MLSMSDPGWLAALEQASRLVVVHNFVLPKHMLPLLITVCSFLPSYSGQIMELGCNCEAQNSILWCLGSTDARTSGISGVMCQLES